MSTSKGLCTALAACLLSVSAAAQDPEAQIGTPATTEELATFFAIMPDGTGLPAGEGTAATGRQIYAEKCAHCHGQNLRGIEMLGNLALVGGRGTLASDHPRKTVESYWPYASTLFDYIWRAMPFDRPGSLAPDDVYSLTAYILAVGEIIDEQYVLNARTLAKIVMPNANGFYDGAGPDLEMYRVQSPDASQQHLANVLQFLRTQTEGSPPPPEVIATAPATLPSGEVAKPAADPNLEVAALVAKADPAKGEAAAAICKACHALEKGAPSPVGPNLYGVLGRKVASVEGFNYTPAMKAHAAEDWNFAHLDALIHKPTDFAPGTMMAFPGLPDANQRAEVIAFLRTKADSPYPLP